MYTKVNGEQQVQILSPNFSISPSNEDYVLNISANGRDFSPLFAVSAGVTRLVSNVAPGSYYKLVGNQSEVVINWQRMCATEGGAAGNELTPVTEFPLNADPGTVVALASGDTYGIYQYDGTNWNEAGADVDLSAYWTSAQTQSAITAVEDHLFDFEEVTSSALTELHEGLLEVSGRTVDMSGYYTSAQTEEAIAEAVEGYATSGDMQSAFTLISETQRVAAAGLNQLEERIDELSAATPSVDLSGYYTSAQTEDAISAATSGKADAASTTANTAQYFFPKWNEQGIITGSTAQAQQSWVNVNGENLFVTYTNSYKSLKLYTPLSAGTAGDILVSTGSGAPVWSAVTMGGNSPIIPAITTQAEYGAISGDVKTGDLIQVYNVDINGDNNPQYGLFAAAVEEEESDGVVRKSIYWERRDNENSVIWNTNDYPWMEDNGVLPIDLGNSAFLISPDFAAEEDEAYNGIGFDDDGKPVITRIAPQYDEETGEITGITREDTPIGADMSAYYTSAQTEDAISAATADFITSGNAATALNGYSKLTPDNDQGVLRFFRLYQNGSSTATVIGNPSINGEKMMDNSMGKNFVLPTSADVKTQIEDYNYVTSAQVETQIVEKNYITSAATANMVTSTSVSTIWKGTQAEYDAIPTKDPNTFYIIVSN